MALVDPITKYVTEKMVEDFQKNKRQFLTSTKWNAVTRNNFCNDNARCDLCCYLSANELHQYSKNMKCRVNRIANSSSSFVVSIIQNCEVQQESGLKVEKYVICDWIALPILASFAVETLSIDCYRLMYMQFCGYDSILIEEENDSIQFQEMDFTAINVANFLIHLINLLDKLTSINYCHGHHLPEVLRIIRKKNDYIPVIDYYGGCSFTFEGCRYMTSKNYRDGYIEHDKKTDCRIANRHISYTSLAPAYDFSLFFSNMSNNRNFEDCIDSSTPLKEVRMLVNSQKYQGMLSAVKKKLTPLLEIH